jgi:uncharacterized protein YndB with AHSA1/START domain
MKWIIRILLGVLLLILLLIAALWLFSLRPNHGHVAAQVAINRPPAQVFRWLTNDDLVKRWIGGLVEIRDLSITPNGPEIGKQFVLGEVYEGTRVNMQMTVTRFDKDRALSIYVASLDDPHNGFTETGDYTLTDENGNTLLRFDVHTKYFGFFTRLLEPLITPEAAKKLNEDLQRLKQLVEAEPDSR